MLNLPTLSISVMAHYKREHWFPYLRERLGDVPFSVDDGTKGIWQNNKDAWALHDPNADYHVVIQDDAIVCDNFHERAREFIARFEGENAFQFFYGNRTKFSSDKEINEALKNTGYVRKTKLSWGVAICLPVRHIKPLAEFGDRHPAWQDDTKIDAYIKSVHLPVIYPIPCFIDHRKMEENRTLVPSKDSDRFSHLFIDNPIADAFVQPFFPDIPKIIHQIWIGDQSKKPEFLMNTWKQEGWEYKLWREKEIDDLGLVNRKLYDYYVAKGQLYGASDVARIEILEKYGGVYIDADTERLLDISPLLSNQFFAVESNMKERIANGIIGSVPQHSILKSYIIKMGRAPKVDPPWSTIGGTLFTKMIKRDRTDFTKILPAHTFYPYDSQGQPARTSGITYGRHYWKADQIVSGNHKEFQL